MPDCNIAMPHSTLPIDIVIPVYRGEPETRLCLESVISASVQCPAEIIVIDDASPEPAISAWLKELQSKGDIRLIVHAENRGFVATANEGMNLHPERDVVLLNSDTEVAPGWLDRLCAHADNDTRVATVTPFSNNATICSYPNWLEKNALPEDETTASLDAVCAKANAGMSADIPTAVGFCMYIARRCINRVGNFDEARYGAGYGEEVDFCLRASRADFVHRLAADVFVRHVGEVSFGNSGMDRRAQAQVTVDTLYPEFQERLRSFIPADPLRELRERIDKARQRPWRRIRRWLTGRWRFV